MAPLAPMHFATPDWAERLRRLEMPLDVDAHRPALNPVRVDEAVRRFDALRLPDVPGQPKIADAGAPWQRNCLALAAGGLHNTAPKGKPPELQQLVSVLGLAVPKKNSKTSCAAAFTLVLAGMSPRPNAQVLLLGAEQSIANLSFQTLAGMIACDDELREQWHVREHLKVIQSRASGVTIAVKSFSMEAVTGSKPAIVLLDEAHLLTQADAMRVMGQVRGGMASVPEAQLIWISTQSDVVPRGFWKEELAKARRVRDGTTQLPGYCPVLYEPPPEFTTSLQAASQPALWPMVNPNLGRSVTLQWLHTSFAEAAQAGETEIRRWLSQHANVEVSAFEAAEQAWGGAAAWAQAADTALTVDTILADSQQLVVALDGGGMDDLLAVVVYGRLGDTWRAACRVWAHPVVLERRQTIAALLQDFQAQGDLEFLDDHTQLQPVVDFILRAFNAVPGALIAADPAGVAQEISEALQLAGVPPQSIVSVRQGFGLLPAYTHLDRALRAGTVRHAGQAVLDWCVSNARQDPNTRLVSKKASGASKIDALVALAIADAAALGAAAPVDVAALIG